MMIVKALLLLFAASTARAMPTMNLEDLEFEGDGHYEISGTDIDQEQTVSERLEVPIVPNQGESRNRKKGNLPDYLCKLVACTNEVNSVRGMENEKRVKRSIEDSMHNQFRGADSQEAKGKLHHSKETNWNLTTATPDDISNTYNYDGQPIDRFPQILHSIQKVIDTVTRMVVDCLINKEFRRAGRPEAVGKLHHSKESNWNLTAATLDDIYDTYIDDKYPIDRFPQIFNSFREVIYAMSQLVVDYLMDEDNTMYKQAFPDVTQRTFSYT